MTKGLEVSRRKRVASLQQLYEFCLHKSAVINYIIVCVVFTDVVY